MRRHGLRGATRAGEATGPRRRHKPAITGPGLGSLLLHRLMGLEAKEAQYADGAAFVRSVVTRIGHEGLNAVWTDPELLPTPAELARPDVWVRRVS